MFEILYAKYFTLQLLGIFFKRKMFLIVFHCLYIETLKYNSERFSIKKRCLMIIN